MYTSSERLSLELVFVAQGSPQLGLSLRAQNQARVGAPQCVSSKLLAWKLPSWLRGVRSWVLRSSSPETHTADKCAENASELFRPQSPSNLNHSIEFQNDIGEPNPDLNLLQICTSTSDSIECIGRRSLDISKTVNERQLDQAVLMRVSSLQ